MIRRSVVWSWALRCPTVGRGWRRAVTGCRLASFVSGDKLARTARLLVAGTRRAGTAEAYIRADRAAMRTRRDCRGGCILLSDDGMGKQKQEITI